MKLNLTYSVRTWLIIQNHLPLTTAGDRMWFKIETKVFCKDVNARYSVSFNDKEIAFIGGLTRKLGIDFQNPLA